MRPWVIRISDSRMEVIGPGAVSPCDREPIFWMGAGVPIKDGHKRAMGLLMVLSAHSDDQLRGMTQAEFFTDGPPIAGRRLKARSITATLAHLDAAGIHLQPTAIVFSNATRHCVVAGPGQPREDHFPTSVEFIFCLAEPDANP